MIRLFQEERAIVCAPRRTSGLAFDELTLLVSHHPPHLNRDVLYRILASEGLGRLPPAHQCRRESGTFKDFNLGFVYIDIKHLPKLQTADRQPRKRYLYVATNCCSRWVHMAAKHDQSAGSAIALPKEAVRAFYFKVAHILTDRGSYFTADGSDGSCRKLKVQHRTTKPYMPQTYGLAERFNRRVQREVLGSTIYSHRDPEMLLEGFSQAYNRRRQRMLRGSSPEQLVRSRFTARHGFANPRYKLPDQHILS